MKILLSLALGLVLASFTPSLVVGQEKLLKLIDAGKWERVLTDADGIDFFMDLNSIKRSGDTVLSYVRTTKRQTTTYEALMGDCGSDKLMTLYAYKKYSNQNSLELVEGAGENEPTLAKKDTVGWGLLDYACENAKAVAGGFDALAKDALLTGRKNN